jgi:CheY-like chemotaxis protein
VPTIVVIDDDPDVRRALKDRFTAKGFRCLTAANGAVGIQLIALHRPDLVICDFEMPVMNGLEVLKRLRHALDFQNMPFVLMTGNKNIYRLLANARLEVEGLVKKTVPA